MAAGGVQWCRHPHDARLEHFRLGYPVAELRAKHLNQVYADVQQQLDSWMYAITHGYVMGSYVLRAYQESGGLYTLLSLHLTERRFANCPLSACGLVVSGIPSVLSIKGDPLRVPVIACLCFAAAPSKLPVGV